MKPDIVVRLRDASVFDSWPRELFLEAASEIERAREELRKCRNCLPTRIEHILYHTEG